MAQAKARTSPKRSRGAKKSQARSGSSAKSQKARQQKARRAKAQQSRSAPSASAKPATEKISSAADKATSAAGNAADKATSAAGNATTAVGHAAGKAKMPLIASGAALAGVAGGAVLGARQARRHRRGFAKAAKGVGALGVQAGHLASDLQRNREANGHRRSPLEVVLEGLTARRSAE
jgi:hypothetical protein